MEKLTNVDYRKEVLALDSGRERPRVLDQVDRNVAYSLGFFDGLDAAASVTGRADSTIESLARELVEAHNRLLLVVDCLDRGFNDEARLHAESLVRPRRNVLAHVGITV